QRLAPIADELAPGARVDLGLGAYRLRSHDPELASHSRMDVAEIVVGADRRGDVDQLVDEGGLAGREVQADVRPEHLDVMTAAEGAGVLAEGGNAAHRWPERVVERDWGVAVAVIAPTGDRVVRRPKYELVRATAGGNIGGAAAVVVGEGDRVDLTSHAFI